MTTEHHEPGSADAILPEQRVGAAMRQARSLSGVSLRQLARQLGYHSHTTLSSYERGALMPTDEVVRGYELVLGLADGSLARTLEEARIERHGDAWAKRRVHLPPDFGQAGSDARPGNAPAPLAHMRFRKRWVALGAAAVVIAASGITIGIRLVSSPARHSPHVTAAFDGRDPKVMGCAIGAVTAASADVYLKPAYLAGVLQLRTSPRCGASWARFIPSPTLPKSPPLIIEIDVRRPADSAVARFRIGYKGQDVYGNMLVSRYECTYAQVTLIRQGQPASAPVATKCMVG